MANANMAPLSEAAKGLDVVMYARLRYLVAGPYDLISGYDMIGLLATSLRDRFAPESRPENGPINRPMNEEGGE